jgi:hypothetical protein
MVDVVVDVREVYDFAGDLSSARIGGELAEAVNAGLAQGVSLAQGFAPYLYGVLSGDIRILRAASAGNLSGSYGTTVVYAYMREYGGTITARNAPYLVFQVGGRWVQVKSVTQTGTHYMGRSRDALEPLLKAALADALMRALRNV